MPNSSTTSTLGDRYTRILPVQVVLGAGLPEVFHQVVGPDEVGAVSVLDGPAAPRR